MRGMRGTRGMFTRIPGNLLEDSGECYHFNIPGNVPKDSGECLRRSRGMFKKIPGNAQEDFGELRDLKNTRHRVGTINLKLEN